MVIQSHMRLYRKGSLFCILLLVGFASAYGMPSDSMCSTWLRGDILCSATSARRTSTFIHHSAWSRIHPRTPRSLTLTSSVAPWGGRSKKAASISRGTSPTVQDQDAATLSQECPSPLAPTSVGTHLSRVQIQGVSEIYTETAVYLR